jgi:hypothetical protein
MFVMLPVGPETEAEAEAKKPLELARNHVQLPTVPR